MAENAVPQKAVIRVLSEEQEMDYFNRITETGNICAGPFEDFTHYYNQQNNEFFYVVHGYLFHPMAAIGVIRHGNRSIATVIPTDPPDGNDPAEFLISRYERSKIPSPACLNSSRSISLPGLYEGPTFWNIQEYYLQNVEGAYPNHVVTSDARLRSHVRYIDIGNVEDIVECDLRLFSLQNRRDFITMCRNRSDIIFGAYLEGRLCGFAMLSLSEGTKRLLGPLYVQSPQWGPPLIDHIVDEAIRKGYQEDIIVYGTEPSGQNILQPSGFQPTNEMKRWTRHSGPSNNYDLNAERIVAFGSLLFDVC